ncbi:2-oxoglutarate and iron-dependent oxygenase domain-containing protein [Mesorhizobium sp.]|uniref:isopenicillin N synthase family dioxygenase n=1 Tax=Mesorhizobium sp. TaxID=1871066 RepID=UPI00257E4411|nr:2-oxoglutarate and iron-dependent oxygenase domain-containing protein [Mesorhizobium sp.]
MTTKSDPNDSLRAQRQSFDKIPIVDVGPLLDNSGAPSVAKDIRWAFENVGFMYVKNHGVPAQLLDDTFAQARAFFDQPLEEKMKLHMANSGVAMHGYVEFFGENADPANTKDLKECFDIGPERPILERPFFGPNQWPSTLPGFRETVFAYHEAMKDLATKLLRGIALSLDLPRDFFDSRVTDPITYQRLLRYPTQLGQVEERIIGIGAHIDYGSLTILAQDSVGGLQVMNREGVWVEGAPIIGTFVINIGELLQILTNGLYIANYHRVVNTFGRERYSIPFFIDADYDAVVQPLERYVSPSNPSRYLPVICGEHKFGRLAKTFPHLERVGLEQ